MLPEEPEKGAVESGAVQAAVDLCCREDVVTLSARDLIFLKLHSSDARLNSETALLQSLATALYRTRFRQMRTWNPQFALAAEPGKSCCRARAASH